MIYDFIFSNTSEDKDFFLYILANEAQNLQLEAFFYTHNQQTHCLIPNLKTLIESHYNSTNLLESFITQKICLTENILTFANNMTHLLPLSLYFSFLQLNPINPTQTFYEILNTLDSKLSLKDIFMQTLPLAIPDYPPNVILEDAQSILSHFHMPKTYYYTPLQTQQILNPESENFALLNPPNAPTHKALTMQDKTYFIDIIHSLKKGQNIAFCTSRGTQLLSLAPTAHTHTTILCDIASLKTYFRTKESYIHTLASFEKPLTYLVPKEVFENQFPLNECGLVKVGLPYDMPLALISALLLQDEIGYFFLSHTTEKPYCDFSHSPAPKEQILSIAQNGMFIDTHIAQNHTLQSLIDTHIEADSKESHLVIYLSTKHPSAFLITHNPPKILLDISFDNNPHLMLETIARSYESGDELIKNFGTHFPQILLNIFNLPKTSSPTHNLIDIFDTCALILGLQPHTATNTTNKNTLFHYAYRFVRERGPRIDYKLLREGNNLSLDYPRIVRSCISFKCAKMEDEILSFGILDSLSEFIATFVRDCSTNLALHNVLLLGDMLGNHIFLDKILEYLPKNIRLILPKNGFIDYE